MDELARRDSHGDELAKTGSAGKLARLAADLERKAATIRQEVRVDMRISEILAEAEVEQDRLERG